MEFEFIELVLIVIVLAKLFTIDKNMLNRKTTLELLSRIGTQELGERFLNTLSKINDRKIERFVDIMFHTEITVDELAPVTLDYYSRQCTLVKVDYLNDEVHYIYKDSTTKYYRNQEDADKYAATGEYIRDYQYNESEEYPYAGVYEHNSTGICTISDWIDRPTHTEVENGTVN